MEFNAKRPVLKRAIRTVNQGNKQSYFGWKRKN